MASIALVTGAVTGDGAEYIEDLLLDLGHTVTKFDDLAVTAGNLSAFDLIVNEGLDTVNTTTLAGFYNTYMSSDSIPILFLNDHAALSDDNFITSSAFVQNIMGVTAVNYRQRFAGGVDPQGYGLLVPETDTDNHEVSMLVDAHENILGQAFLQPSFQGTYEGESFVWGNVDSDTGSKVTAQPKDGKVAGTPLVRLQSSFWGTYREVVACVILSGDSRVGAVTGTFPVNCAWCGFMPGPITTRNGGHMVAAMVGWCLGDYDAVTTYSTTAKSSSFRYPSFALDTINGTTYGSSTISWTETTPTNTSVTVGASLDGESFSTIASSGDPIPGLSVGNALAGRRLTLRVELATTDGVSTPQFSGLEVILNAEQASLTIAPADFFQEGHLTWTSGGNNAQSMEVKSYDGGTQTLKLFLKMRSTVEVGDTFTILPGCDKKRATCQDKFANVVNFQGEPDVPGEDQTLKAADVQ